MVVPSGSSLSLSSLGDPNPLTLRLRFHIPLIEPDRRISRIRLSDKMSHFRPRKAAGSLRQINQSQMFIQVLIRVSCPPFASNLVFLAQPPAEPIRHMGIDGPICQTYRPKAKIIRPAVQFPVQTSHNLFGI